MVKNSITTEKMTAEMAREYFVLTNKTDRTKEEDRQLETLKKRAKINGAILGVENIEKLENVNVLYYDKVPGLYRIQAKISGKYKTVARVKLSRKDVYVLTRETTAKALNKDYEIINYNLPAGFFVDLEKLYTELVAVVNYHLENQVA